MKIFEDILDNISPEDVHTGKSSADRLVSEIDVRNDVTDVYSEILPKAGFEYCFEWTFEGNVAQKDDEPAWEKETADFVISSLRDFALRCPVITDYKIFTGWPETTHNNGEIIWTNSDIQLDIYFAFNTIPCTSLMPIMRLMLFWFNVHSSFKKLILSRYIQNYYGSMLSKFSKNHNNSPWQYIFNKFSSKQKFTELASLIRNDSYNNKDKEDIFQKIMQKMLKDYKRTYKPEYDVFIENFIWKIKEKENR